MTGSKTLRLSTALLGCLFAHAALANEVYYIGLERGDFEIDNNDYQEETGASSLLIGVTENQYNIQLTEYKFDDAMRGEDETAYRRLEGRSLQLGREFRLTDKLNMELAYGRFWWEAREYQDDISVGKRSGAGRLLEGQLSANFGRVRVYASRKQMRDVAGDDVKMTMFGARYFFK